MSPSPGGIIYAADVQEAREASVERPRVKLVQTAGQNLLHNTDTALSFGTGSTDVDTHGLHSETVNPTRVTFDRDGTWNIRSILFMAAPGAAVRYNLLQLACYKNGAVQTSRVRWPGPAVDNVSGAIIGEFEIEADAGDYAEVVAMQQASTSGTKTTSAGGSFSSTMEVTYVRERS